MSDFIFPPKCTYHKIGPCSHQYARGVYGLFGGVVCRLKRGKPIEPGKEAEEKDKEVGK